MTARICKYRCCACAHEFHLPGTVEIDTPNGRRTINPAVNGCPGCGHLYVVWLNFESLKYPCLVTDSAKGNVCSSSV